MGFGWLDADGSPLGPPPCWAPIPGSWWSVGGLRAATVPGIPSGPWPHAGGRRRDLVGLAGPNEAGAWVEPPIIGRSPAMPPLWPARYDPFAGKFDLSGRRLWPGRARSPSGLGIWGGAVAGCSPSRCPPDRLVSRSIPAAGYWHTGRAVLCAQVSRCAKDRRRRSLPANLLAACEVCWSNAPIRWRSNQQPAPALSGTFAGLLINGEDARAVGPSTGHVFLQVDATARWKPGDQRAPRPRHGDAEADAAGAAALVSSQRTVPRT